MDIDFDAWRRRIRANTFGNYHYEMGVALEREGGWSAAIASYGRAIDIDPSLAAARLRLVNALTHAGDTARAQKVEAEARAYDPAFRERATYRLAKELAEGGQLEAATATLAAVDQEARVPPHERGEAWLAVAGALAKQEDFAQALQAYQQGLKISPQDVETLLGAANAAFRSNDAAEAVRLARTAFAVDQTARTSYLLGFYSMALGETSAAIEAFDAAKANGYTPASHCTLHAALAALANRPGLALAGFDEVLANEAHNVVAASFRAIALLGLGQREPALRAAEAARSMTADTPHTLTNLALCLEAVGRSVEASKLLDQARASGKAWPHYAAASLAVRAGSEARVQALLDEAQRLEPQWVRYYLGLLPGGSGKGLQPLMTLP